MTAIHTGGQAFPSHGSMGEVVSEGMTLRDYFAGQALLGLCARIGAHNTELMAHDAYVAADAMIAARGHS